MPCLRIRLEHLGRNDRRILVERVEEWRPEENRV